MPYISVISTSSVHHQYREMYVVQVEEILFRMIMDCSEAVSSASFELLLPSVLRWMGPGESVYSRIILAALSQAAELIEDSPYPPTTEFGLVRRGEAEMHIPRETQQRKVGQLDRSWQHQNILPVALKLIPRWPLMLDSATATYSVNRFS